MNVMMTNYALWAQLDIFEQSNFEELGDLELLKQCFLNIPMEPVIQALNKDRKNGRNDYPNDVLLRMIIAKYICQFDSIEKLRRELMRNPSLRRLCGLKDADHCYGKKKLVPNSNVFTGFLKRLAKHQNLFDEMFSKLVVTMYEHIPDFGKNLAGDGKYLDSYAPNDHHNNAKDGRSENDASWSLKVYKYIGADGKKHEKKETHHGFRAHVIVDTKTGLPVCFEVTTASIDEKQVMSGMIENGMTEEQLKLLLYIMLDRGYDSAKMLEMLRSKGIKPIVDNRIMRKGDKTIQYKDSDVYYTESGECYYLDYGRGEDIDEKTGLPKYFAPMKYEGYDKIRKALRYSYKDNKVRLKISEDPRVFNEVARDSKKFKRLYNERTSVERYNGRLDRDYCFEKHCVRGLKKMKLLVTIANVVMLAIAKAHIDKGQTNYASMFNF